VNSMKGCHAVRLVWFSVKPGPSWVLVGLSVLFWPICRARTVLSPSFTLNRLVLAHAADLLNSKLELVCMEFGSEFIYCGDTQELEEVSFFIYSLL
jgi:hypothetical protein